MANHRPSPFIVLRGDGLCTRAAHQLSLKQRRVHEAWHEDPSAANINYTAVCATTRVVVLGGCDDISSKYGLGGVALEL